MCGVPHHAADGYIAKLVAKGYKVAICDQLEPPGLHKGPVKRDVVRVVTPGTVIDPNVLDQSSNNYICALSSSDKKVGIACADVTTGEFYTYSVDRDTVKIQDEICRIAPAEIVVREDFADYAEDNAGRLTFRDSRFFEYKAARASLIEHFRTHSLDGFGLEDDKAAICAAGGLLAYLKDTQKNALQIIYAVKSYAHSEYLAIDSSSRRNLELTESLKDKKKTHSLLWVLDKTKTAMGSRTLRRWICEPLTSIPKIITRQDSVDELFKDAFTRASLRETLSKMQDIERLTGRISHNTATARDLLSLKSTAEVLPLIKSALAACRTSFLAYIREETDMLDDIHALIDAAIDDDAPALLSMGGFVKDGYNAELDSYVAAKTGGAQLVLAMETKERELTGIKNLKIKFNKVFGYVIELTNTQKDMAPTRYKRIQTLSNCERYSTPELKEIEERIFSAEERISTLEMEIWKSITGQISAQISRILQVGNTIAALDVLLCLAEVADQNKYTRPVLSGAGVLNIVDGRHPVIERIAADSGKGRFIPNDLLMNTTSDRLLTITGPNMAGKSTYMRQAALIILMAQMGGFVPARSAEIGVCDKIFTRVGASDDLATGQSTFMVEMAEVANIVHNATKNSFIILDEIGRGTSTYDGMAIAWATLEYIANSKNLGARTLFSTHYHEMTELEGKIDGVVNYNIAVKESGEDILFLHKVIRGGANKSYGIHVARLAGLPPKIIDRALEIIQTLTSATVTPVDPALPTSAPPDDNVVVYNTNPKKQKNTGRITLRQHEDGVHQLSITDVLREKLRDMPGE